MYRVEGVGFRVLWCKYPRIRYLGCGHFHFIHIQTSLRDEDFSERVKFQGPGLRVWG